MFGLVPKTIWSRAMPPDERNGIQQNANVLLAENDNGTRGLLDTGCGDPARIDDQTLHLRGMNREWPLMDALASLHIEPESISFIALTHLHWDHAGGLARLAPDGSTVPTFPNAAIYVHEKEWADATSGDPLLYKSYPKEIIEPIQHMAKGQLQLVTDESPEIMPGISLHRSGGHTRGHAVIQLKSDIMELIHPQATEFGPLKEAWFTGDVCPTRHHLRMVYQTSYDTYPLETRQWKRDRLAYAARENVALFFDHDPVVLAARIRTDPKREYEVTDVLAGA